MQKPAISVRVEPELYEKIMNYMKTHENIPLTDAVNELLVKGFKYDEMNANENTSVSTNEDNINITKKEKENKKRGILRYI